MFSNGEQLHKAPYKGTNNRKKTRGRVKADQKIQSVPMFEKVSKKLLGYRYIIKTLID